jgi:hypothetical protein
MTNSHHHHQKCLPATGTTTMLLLLLLAANHHLVPAAASLTAGYKPNEWYTKYDEYREYNRIGYQTAVSCCVASCHDKVVMKKIIPCLIVFFALLSFISFHFGSRIL